MELDQPHKVEYYSKLTSNIRASVIMPIHNMPLNLVARALNSLLLQQNSKYQPEVVICNDGSTPLYSAQLREVIELYSRHIPLVLCSAEHNQGISASRNLAVQFARGEWLVWLDGDDELECNAVGQLISHGQQTGLPLIISECRVIDDTGNYRRSPIIYLKLARQYYQTFYDPLAQVIFSLQAQAIRRDTFLELGGFNLKYKWAELTELFLRFVYRHGIHAVGYVSNCLYKYYRRLGSHSSIRFRLEQDRKQALLWYSEMCKLKVDDLEYLGRAENTGCQHYILSFQRGKIYPPYIELDQESGSLRVNDKRSIPI